MDDLQQLFGPAAFPVVAALVEVAKRMVPELTDRAWPPLALVLGIAWNLLVGYRLGLDFVSIVIFGILTGLAASGLYSQGKTALGR